MLKAQKTFLQSHQLTLNNYINTHKNMIKFKLTMQKFGDFLLAVSGPQIQLNFMNTLDYIRFGNNGPAG